MAQYRRILVAILVVASVFFIFSRDSGVSAQAVAQGYSSNSALQIGMIVNLDSNDTSKIVPTTQAIANKTQGVVVAPNDTPVSLSGNSNSQQYFVATTGTYRVLVSDQNGAIHAGDYIVVSSLAGVGMDDDARQGVVVGKATSEFTGEGSSVLSTATLKGRSGRTQTVHLGYVTMAVNVGSNPLVKQSALAGVPGFLQKTSESIANKPVSAARAFLSLGVLIISAVIAGSMLYAGVKTSIVAVGRNPLARRTIFRDLLQVVFTSLIVFVVGIFAVYLLLKL